MPITAEEKKILRQLAMEYRACAENPVNAERERRARDTIALKPGRPLVWIFEEPWNEINVDDQLTMRCTDPFAREMETFFRRQLLRWKYYQADMLLENFYRVGKSWSSTGDGFTIQENIAVTDKENHIVSHEYTDLLKDEEALEKIQIPTITAHPEKDAQNVALAEEILDGILPVRLCGHYHYASIWDRISMLRGVGPMYLDLALRPEFTHEMVKKFVAVHTATVDQMDAQGLLSGDLPHLHCTPCQSDELDEIEKKNGPSIASSWFRGLAQPFSSVSPDMHEEFEIDYIKPLAERFGFTYYGCCEPLSDRIEQLSKIKNLRKIGVSPWSGIWESAEQMGSKYVFSRKPNPAMVAGSSLDEDAIRADIRECAQACIKYGCAWDITLKDISTVGYRIQNLARWAEVVEETLDEFY